MHNWKATQSMHKRLLISAVLAATWLGVTPLNALTPTPTATPTVMPTATTVFASSKDNFEGDRVTFPVNLPVTVFEGYGSPHPATLKAGTALRGIGQSTPAKVDFVVTHCSPYLGFFSWARTNKDVCDGSSLVQPCAACGVLLKVDANGKVTTDTLTAGSIVQIDLAEIHNHPPNRYGLAYGGMVVPFKFQLTGAHQLSSSATVGPYLGYRFAAEYYGWAATLAAFAGASNIGVTKVGPTPGSTTTQQLAGFSYGGGMLLEVKGGFQAGAVCGFDSVGSGQGFQYNNKPWLALQLGYSFSQ